VRPICTGGREASRAPCRSLSPAPAAQAASSALMHYREALKAFTRETAPLAHARVHALMGAVYESLAGMQVRRKDFR
jgi:hypothetical protein